MNLRFPELEDPRLGVDPKLYPLHLSLGDELHSCFMFLTQMLPFVEWVEDRSPVMSSPESYLGKVDFGKPGSPGRIELNGFFLDRCEAPNLTRQFLLFHELFHLARAKNEVSLFRALTEEESADLIGLFAVADLRGKS